MELSRRSFVASTGALAATAVATGTVTSALADSAEADTDGQVAEILYQRTTLHGDFDTESPVSDEELSLIIDAAFSAPTGGNQRAIDFFPVNDPDVLAKMREAHQNFGALETAPLVVVITTNHDLEMFPELLQLDAGIAAMAMIVQATQLGLSTCCMSIMPQYDRMSGIGAALNLPTDTNSPVYDPIIMVAIGHPSVDVEAGASVENYTADQVHLNGFQA